MSEFGSATPIEVGLKDVLVFIPLVASCLAITWEVGYFSRIGAGSFDLFSLAEHITFAFQALPLAIAVSAMAAFGVAKGSVLKPVMILPSGREFRVLKNGKLWTMALVFACIAGLAIAKLVTNKDWLTLSLGSFGLLPFVYVSLVPHRYLQPSASVAGGFLCVFLASFGLGYASARAAILSTSGLSRLTLGEKGKEAESAIEVRILRAGERGVLYFDPQNAKFGLLPWDHVKRMDWSPTSLFQR